uniref:G-protein coupled receptors family 1 profile domain-containing protein n=1 Tax=Amphimedon queenslandica TaxID=400682 RepID=A0A1X7TU70_AMPQE
MESNFSFTGSFNRPVAITVLSITTLAALIANSVVLFITLYQRKSWKQSSTIFFTSLILSNFILNLLYLPFTIIALAVGEWIFGSTDEEKRGTCAFAAFIVCYTVLVQSFTLAAISFDRFLFIVKPHLHKRFMRPWVALTLTIAIWILSALFGSTPFYGLGKFAYLPNVGTCSPAFTEYFFVGYSAAIEVAVFLFIIITSVWTFCFTYKFIRDQSAIGEESVYLSRKKRLVGIFGAMLLVYVICLLPIFTVAILFPVVDISSHVVASVVFVLHLFTVINPLVQSYFRPGFKDLILTVVMKWPKRRLTNAMLRLNRMPNQSN